MRTQTNRTITLILLIIITLSASSCASTERATTNLNTNLPVVSWKGTTTILNDNFYASLNEDVLYIFNNSSKTESGITIRSHIPATKSGLLKTFSNNSKLEIVSITEEKYRGFESLVMRVNFLETEEIGIHRYIPKRNLAIFYMGSQEDFVIFEETFNSIQLSP